MKVYGNMNMTGGAEIIEIVVDSGTSDPSSPAAGELFYRTDLQSLRFYNGSSWTSTGSSTSGTVTSVSVVTANGVSGTVATSTTTPAITLTLGAITPSSIAATGPISTNVATLDTTTTGPISMTAGSPTTIDLSSSSSVRAVKYLVSVSEGTTAYHGCEIFVVQDGTTAYKTEYAEIYSGSSLGTFDAIVSGGNVVLQFTPATSATYTVHVVKTQIAV